MPSFQPRALLQRLCVPAARQLPSVPSHSPATFPGNLSRLIWESRTALWELCKPTLSRTQLPRKVQLWRSTGKAKNPAAQLMLFVCSKGEKKGNCIKNSIFQLFILWAVSAHEMCFVSTLSSALLSPFPRTLLLIPTDFLLKHPDRNALRVCPRAQLRTALLCPIREGAGSPLQVQVLGTPAHQVSGMCLENCWKHTPNHTLQPRDTCPECSLQRRTQCVNM